MPTIRAYECNVRGKNWERTIHATSAGKAKAEYWRHVTEPWPDVPYTAITCHVIEGPLTDTEAFRRVAEYRRVPFAHIGMRVEVEKHPGVIVGANDSANFDVLFTAGRFKDQKLNCHPHHMMTYFGENGEVLADFWRAS